MRRVPRSIRTLDLRRACDLALDPDNWTWDWPKVPVTAKTYSAKEIVSMEDEERSSYGCLVVIVASLVAWAIIIALVWWVWP
jgi:hypothetical protein